MTSLVFVLLGALAGGGALVSASPMRDMAGGALGPADPAEPAGGEDEAPTCPSGGGSGCSAGGSSLLQSVAHGGAQHHTQAASDEVEEQVDGTEGTIRNGNMCLRAEGDDVTVSSKCSGDGVKWFLSNNVLVREKLTNGTMGRCLTYTDKKPASLVECPPNKMAQGLVGVGSPDDGDPLVARRGDTCLVPTFQMKGVGIQGGPCVDYDIGPNKPNVYMFGSCHAQSNQQFFFDSAGRLVTMHDLRSDRKCLDFHKETKNVFMNACQKGKKQKWKVQGSQLVSELKVGGDQMCVDGGGGCGNVYMVKCDKANVNQTFSLFYQPVESDEADCPNLPAWGFKDDDQ